MDSTNKKPDEGGQGVPETLPKRVGAPLGNQNGVRANRGIRSHGRHLGGLTELETAKLLDITRGGVWMLERNAIRKLWRWGPRLQKALALGVRAHELGWSRQGRMIVRRRVDARVQEQGPSSDAATDVAEIRAKQEG